MDKSTREIEDFVTNANFREWVLNTNPLMEEYWDKWMKSHPDKIGTLRIARDILITSCHSEESHTQEEILDELEKIRSNIQAKESSRAQFIRYGIAASIFLCLAIGYLFFSQATFTYKHQTLFGEKKDIILPDDSKVILNSNSTIKYDEWTAGREVWLSGEAYFKVQKQYDTDLKDIKFTVHTGTLDIEVLGTEFNVWQRDEKTEVSLNEGKIVLRIKDHDKIREIEMFPGDMISYSDGSILKRSFGKKQFASWLDNRLIFERTTLIDIAKRIEDNYGIMVAFEDKAISNKMISGTIPSDNLEILVTALSKTFNIDIIHKEDQLIFKAK